MMSADEIVNPRELRERGSRLLAGDVVYLPVRHHSPACARRVEEVIRARPPHVVLVEGPPSFDDLIDLLVHPQATMPLAVHCHVAVGTGPDQRRLGAYYPVCDYSPELVALRVGAEVGARLGFADLDYVDLASLGGLSTDRPVVDDGPMPFSEALCRLAADLGCRDHDDLWDQLIETSDAAVADFFAAVGAYGLLARSDVDPAAEVTSAREQAMAEVVAAAARDRLDGAGPVVVVLGAYHVATVPDLVAERLRGGDLPPPPRRHRLPTEEHGHALVRYSFDRLDRLSGYASGQPSPAWYQRVWQAPEGHDACYSALADIADRLRRHGLDGQPSTPTLAAALTQAILLADLRGRARIGRTDLLDAVAGCFTPVLGGGDRTLADAVVEVLTGHRVGALPPGTPRSPLAADVDRLAADLRLDLSDSRPRELVLDLYRDERHRRLSRMLHALRLLKVRLAVPVRQPTWRSGTGRDVIREVWQVGLTAATDTTLAEAARWGSSLHEATRNLLQHSLTEAAAGSTRDLVRVLVDAARSGCHDAAADTLTSLRRAVARETDLRAGVAAFIEMELLWSARRPLGATAMVGLPELAGQLLLRCTRLVAALGGCGDGDAAELAVALVDLASLVRTAGLVAAADVDAQLFWESLNLLDCRASHPFMRSVAAGLAWQRRSLSGPELAARLAGELAGPHGPAFLTGLLMAAREALWAGPDLSQVLTRALADWDEEAFLARLPGIRAAFAGLTPRETDRFAGQVAQLLGRRVDRRVDDLDQQALLATLTASAEVESRLRADGLGGWLDD